MKKTIVLGITAFNHDSSAGLIKNGKIVAFGEEERFNGIKHTDVFPSQAVNYCLREQEENQDIRMPKMKDLHEIKKLQYNEEKIRHGKTSNLFRLTDPFCIWCQDALQTKR